MGFGDRLLVKPGTIFMFLLIAVFGFGIFNWASDSINTTGEKSLKQQDDAFRCSALSIDLAGLNQRQSNVTAFFTVNQDVEEVRVNFEGEKNLTAIVDYGGANSLTNVTAPLETVETVSFKVDGCNPHSFSVEQ